MWVQTGIVPGLIREVELPSGAVRFRRSDGTPATADEHAQAVDGLMALADEGDRAFLAARRQNAILCSRYRRRAPSIRRATLAKKMSEFTAGIDVAEELGLSPADEGYDDLSSAERELAEEFGRWEVLASDADRGPPPPLIDLDELASPVRAGQSPGATSDAHSAEVAVPA